MSAERMVTRREAAKLTAFSYDTIRRCQDDGAYPNAVLDENGTWLIPVSDLVAAGDLDPTSPHEASAPAVSTEAGHGKSDEGSEQGHTHRGVPSSPRLSTGSNAADEYPAPSGTDRGSVSRFGARQRTESRSPVRLPRENGGCLAQDLQIDLLLRGLLPQPLQLLAFRHASASGSAARSAAS